MSNSSQFSTLKNRIDSLKRDYLPKHRISGNYSRIENDNMRAFILLSHAEIEFYLEQISMRVVKKALDRLLNKDVYKSKVLVYLAATMKQSSSIENAITVKDKIQKVVEQYFASLRKNNGIKEENIKSILCRIGIDSAELDTTWLATVSSYGSDRGLIAHNSAKAQKQFEPDDIRKDIKFIVDEIKRLDQKVRNLS